MIGVGWDGDLGGIRHWFQSNPLTTSPHLFLICFLYCSFFFNDLSHIFKDSEGEYIYIDIDIWKEH